MKSLKLSVVLLCFFITNKIVGQSKELNDLIDQFKNPGKGVLVAAHRGDWRNAPENSIRAALNCIAMGVDIVETDVRKTKDGVLIIMHDETLDRTTSGKGKVNEVTCEYVRTLFLRDGAGHPTYQRVPTLEELMSAVKGKRILINLDKSWDNIPETYAVLKKTGTIKQGIFKGYETLNEVKSKIGSLLDSIMYMPMVKQEYKLSSDRAIPATDFVNDYLKQSKVVGFEVVYGAQKSSTIANAVTSIRKERITVWINSLWADLCAGHDDELAIEQPEANWGWIIQQGANVIQTDRPEALLKYLASKNLHQLYSK
ncbi:MAG: glycerophosphodiester phosphodiesterase [Azospira oryzae]|jgi:glycerophosphoryl diester phosphodiesterase|nr:MAG: glycerophosphodiester phosphodiesterase [Azospira oryzae]